MSQFFRKRRVLLPISLSAVYDAARHLMLTNQLTTVNDVKNYLQDLDFKANRSDVQSMMDRLCKEEDWYCTPKGEYQFKRDTDEHLETVLQKGKRKIKVIVDGRKLVIWYLREKKKELKEHISNRKAIYDAETWMSEKLEDGYYCAIH